MRLATCLSCKTITKLSDFQGTNSDHDVVLQDWTSRHLHGVPVEQIPGPLHPGAAPILNVDMPDITRSPRFFSMPIEDQERALERIEGVAVTNLQSEMMTMTQQVFTYRDDLRDEASKCYLRHNSPSYPERGCIDFRDDSKRVGRTKVPPKLQKYLCHFCPYSSTLAVELRRRRGAYN